jgi:hypothetical protein
METEQRDERGGARRDAPFVLRATNVAQKAICLWLIANICLLISLYVRVRVLFPDTTAGECSVFLLLWNLIPLLAMLCLIQQRDKKLPPDRLVQLVVVGVSAYGTHEFVDSLYMYPTDAFAGFTMFFVPFFQLLVLLTAFLISELKRGRS